MEGPALASAPADAKQRAENPVKVPTARIMKECRA